jgi:uncharacterized membrane protein YdbT with pleckstrin-like domain
MPTIFESPAKVKKNMKLVPKALTKEVTSMGPLTAFALNPNVRFETQEEEETVILFLRQHFIVNLPWILGSILLFLAPTILIPLLLRALSLSIFVPVGYIVVGTLFWYLATFGFVLANFISWFFNIFIVTNQRIVDIDFYYLLYKNFSQAELTKIQDISYATGGIMATIFNYGNVTIETAGESPNLEFERVPFPQKVVETIRSLTERTESGGSVW